LPLRHSSSGALVSSRPEHACCCGCKGGRAAQGQRSRALRRPCLTLAASTSSHPAVVYWTSCNHCFSCSSINCFRDLSWLLADCPGYWSALRASRVSAAFVVSAFASLQLVLLTEVAFSDSPKAEIEVASVMMESMRTKVLFMVFSFSSEN